MKSIFITGVAGFLGSHLADKFLSEGWKVSGCDNLVGGYVDNVPKGVDFYNIDCNDLEALTNVTKNFDIFYHTACTAYEGLSVFSPSLVSKNTYQISINCMTAAIINKIPKFVHCSSMARYGAQELHPFTEDMICKPQDPYGVAKLASEQALTNLAKIYDIELVIAVPHNIIGIRQKYDDPFRNVASIMLNLMLQGRQPYIYGDGMQVRCFSSIEDDVKCLYMFGIEKIKSGEVFNIGPDENPITILDLSKLIAQTLNFDLKPIFIDARPQEVKFATCSAKKIRDRFNYKTEVSLEETIIKMRDWIINRGTKNFEYHLPVEIINNKTPLTWKTRLF